MSANTNMRDAIERRESELFADTMKIPPSQIEGTPAELWQTLVPVGRQVNGVVVDARVWEFSVTTGRLIQTHF
jgi:hypothetical protein